MQGDAPARNQNWGSFFYFMAFVLICALILLNLYTGVIFSQFAKIAEQNMGSAWLTEVGHESSCAWLKHSSVSDLTQPKANFKVQGPSND